ncbi:hypothetical protein G7046_g2328 [Stylonectria norvegica]|nr:hypothetical protein G7046_g2328 [Stylonectria norvegica]
MCRGEEDPGDECGWSPLSSLLYRSKVPQLRRKFTIDLARDLLVHLAVREICSLRGPRIPDVTVNALHQLATWEDFWIPGSHFLYIEGDIPRGEDTANIEHVKRMALGFHYTISFQAALRRHYQFLLDQSPHNMYAEEIKHRIQHFGVMTARIIAEFDSWVDSCDERTKELIVKEGEKFAQAWKDDGGINLVIEADEIWDFEDPLRIAIFLW